MLNGKQWMALVLSSFSYFLIVLWEGCSVLVNGCYIGENTTAEVVRRSALISILVFPLPTYGILWAIGNYLPIEKNSVWRKLAHIGPLIAGIGASAFFALPISHYRPAVVPLSIGIAIWAAAIVLVGIAASRQGKLVLLSLTAAILQMILMLVVIFVENPDFEIDKETGEYIGTLAGLIWILFLLVFFLGRRLFRLPHLGWRRAGIVVSTALGSLFVISFSNEQVAGFPAAEPTMFAAGTLVGLLFSEVATWIYRGFLIEKSSPAEVSSKKANAEPLK